MDTRSAVVAIRLAAGFEEEEGYALPSILFLVTILTLVAFSVIVLEYLERQVALRQVVQVKAEYAAQSGVVRALLEGSSELASREPFTQKHISFDDGSEAFVRAQPWGVYKMVESFGGCRGIRKMRLACVASQPPEAFRQALILGNNQYQLVFTGTSQIRGDISIGPAGATTGSLHGYSTPATLPLVGRVRGGTGGIQVPQVDRDAIRDLRQYYESLLERKVPALAIAATLAPGERIAAVADSIDIVFTSGSINFQKDSLDHRARPLVVVTAASQGSFSIARGTHVEGLLSVVCEDSIYVPRDVSLNHVVLYSRKAICVEGARLSSSQLIAPRISIDSSTEASYPSALVSLAPSGLAPLRQSICLEAGSSLEGFIYLDSPFGDDLVTVEPLARVVGAIYSTARVTLDGTVQGSVLAGDLYFYEAPTVYLGWLRSGKIDRTVLREGFLVPSVFSGVSSSGILEWL